VSPTRLAVRLTPRGGRDAIEGWTADADGRARLKVRVAAAPVEGAANTALERLIAKVLGLPGSAVRVAAGQSSRLKLVEIDAAPEAVAARLPPPTAG
jgi:uncharacterized protein YggU (UPF0235/DUF167 family)